ncbi:hypothetical protein EVA_15371 [gut metagenome]|uniref:Uncharacterized protein n=1 Tax=gut metagenome TaxID=749906 RepID=J9FPZ9_9ZZZZ
MIASFLSALLFSGIQMANMLCISPDYYENSYRSLMQVYSKMLDSNTLGMMEQMLGNIDKITFFSTLIYCFIYGTVLSLILSMNIPARNPFGPGNEQ